MKQPIKKFYALEQSDDGTATIHLYDEVGAWGQGSKEFLADLGRLKGQHIHLRINSPGGSVVEGTAIYNALRRHTGGLTVHIDALAASMASVIAMAGVPTYIADNALLMIHNPWTITGGDADQLRKEADLLDKLKNTLVNAYTRKTGMEEEEIADMMDKETWLDAVEAVALGFADAIEEGVAAAATATPEQLRARFDKFAQGMSQPETQNPLTEIVETLVESDMEAPSTVVNEVEPKAEEIAPAVEEPAAPAEVPAEEPQAKATAADAILAKYNALAVERDAAVAEVAAYKAKFEDTQRLVEVLRAELSQDRQSLDRLQRSLGLAAAQVVPVVEQLTSEDRRTAILEQLNSTTDPRQRNILARELREI